MTAMRDEPGRAARRSPGRRAAVAAFAPFAAVAPIAAFAVLALLLTFGAGCGRERSAGSGGQSGEGGHPGLAGGARPDPQRIPTAPAVPPDRVAASHVLIAYAGALRADTTVTRTRDEARQLAEQICGAARGRGADFAALAREHSDEATAQSGGYVDVFPRGTMLKPFEDAAFGMEVGQVSDVFETPFGFHVVRREPIQEVAASHILVQWQESARSGGVGGQAPAARQRSKAAALALAESLRSLAIAPGADFADLARSRSDCPTATRGGDLGRFGRGRMLPPIEAAIFGLGTGEISEPIETEFGYHILKRTE